MEKILESVKRHWQDSGNFLIGVWLIASPWTLGFTEVKYAPGNAYIVGVIVAVAAVSALVSFQEWEEWVNITLGVWLILTPWLFDLAAMAVAAETKAAFFATWNFIIAGLLVTGLAAWSTYNMRKHGGYTA